jgi:sec-independent protein translocase protein TatB
MFDVGIWEVGVIGVVALVVLGPERLPKVARTAGVMLGRLQRYVANVKADINREMDASEFAKVKEEVQSAARGFESTMREHANAIEGESKAIEKAVTPAVDAPLNANPGGTSQADLLDVQEAVAPTSSTLPTSANESAKNGDPAANASVDARIDTPANVVSATTSSANAPYAPVQSALPQFDLGIEPPRVRATASAPNAPSRSIQSQT